MNRMDDMSTAELKQALRGALLVNGNLLRMLGLVATETRACLTCGATLYRVRHANGQFLDYTGEGVRHFASGMPCCASEYSV